MPTQIRKPKGQRAEWPKVVTAGSVSVTVYRAKHATNASGFSFILAWKTADGRKTQPFADEGRALEEARLKAAQLAAGRIAAADMTSGDRDELQAARKAATAIGMPLLAALELLAKARELTAGNVLEAAQAWALKQGTSKFKRVTVSEAIDLFIAAKKKTSESAERTYKSKLSEAKTAFPDRFLDEVTAAEWTDFLTKWDGCTRNDKRARLITVCLWARDIAGFLPRGVKTEIEHTEIVKEAAPEIGIVSPGSFASALEWTRTNHPEYLAALTLAGFCGLRISEIHGKDEERKRQGDDCKRQTWEDIDLTQKHLNVTNAKTNTPAWRLVPLCDSAIEWLKLSPGEHKGAICEPGAMQSLRDLLSDAGFELPDNCFRHSFITYRVAATGDKARTADVAGNSVTMIDRHYRRPQAEAVGKAWFAIQPKSGAGEGQDSGEEKQAA